jgi:hypothetical protein
VLTDQARSVAVIDIDGVVADVRHRLRHVERRPKDWDAFFAAAVDDPPLEPGVRRVLELSLDHDLVFLTGRPEHCRADTLAWLEAHGLGGWPVRMRRGGDRRPARQTKASELDRLSRRAVIALVLDDDPAVCEALRAAGYQVEQADWMTRPAALDDAQEREGRT